MRATISPESLAKRYLSRAEAERYLSRAETAEMIGLQPQTLAKWAVVGMGPKFLKLNARVVRYRLSDVLAFLESSDTR